MLVKNSVIAQRSAFMLTSLSVLAPECLLLASVVFILLKMTGNNYLLN
jgi:hypothetical protein